MADNESESVPAPSSPPPVVVAPARYIHSGVWDSLVQGPDDLAGMVAYGLYQQRKREWIASCQERDKCLPSEAAVKDFSFTYRGTVIVALRDEADGLLYRFSADLSESQLPDMIRHSFNQRAVEEVSEFRRELTAFRKYLRDRTGYTHHLMTHVVGFLSIAGLIALVTLAAEFDNGPRQIVDGIVKVLTGHSGS